MRYLSQRSSGIWYFRYQIPPKFRSHFSGQTEYKRSLHTRCRYTAKLRSAELQQRLWKNLVLIEQHINENNEERTSVDGFLKFFQLNERNVFGFSDELKRKIVKRLTHCLEVLESQPNLVRAQLRRIELQNEDSSDFIGSVDIIESLCNRNITPLHAAERYLSRLPFADNLRELHYSEEIRNVAITLFRHVYNFQQRLDALDVEGARIILSRIEEYEWRDINKSYSDRTADYYLQCRDNGIVHKINRETCADEQLVTQPSKVVDIEAVLESYKLEKQNQKKGMKEVEAVIHACRLVHDLLGTNDMAKVSRDDVNRIIPDVKLFPKNARGTANKKHFGNLNARDILEKNKQLKLPVRQEEQALRDIGRVSTLYRWAIEWEKIARNPFLGFADSKSKVKRNFGPDGFKTSKLKKVPFSDLDLKKMFSHPVFTQLKFGRNPQNKMRLNFQYWAMLIAYTTGTRPNEVCQLRMADVRYVENILCFLIQEVDDDQSLKNDNAARLIPVPDILFKLGFQSYLDSVRGGRMLFPELTYTKDSGYYGKVEDWFTRTFSKPMNLTSQKKSFYSLRHTFVFDYQKRSQRCPIVADLVGHANGSITDDTYGGVFAVQLLKDKVNEFDSENVLKNVMPYKI